MTNDELDTELRRAYRAIRGIYGKIANGETPDKTMLAYHSAALGAAIRFVDQGEFDGAQYFTGKPIEVLHDALRRYVKAGPLAAGGD